jgi:hypothetical protein
MEGQKERPPFSGSKFKGSKPSGSKFGDAKLKRSQFSGDKPQGSKFGVSKRGDSKFGESKFKRGQFSGDKPQGSRFGAAKFATDFSAGDKFSRENRPGSQFSRPHSNSVWLKGDQSPDQSQRPKFKGAKLEGAQRARPNTERERENRGDQRQWGGSPSPRPEANREFRPRLNANQRLAITAATTRELPLALERLDEVDEIAERAATDLLNVSEALSVYIDSLQAAVKIAGLGQSNEANPEFIQTPSQIFQALTETLPRFGESSTLIVNIAGFHDQIGQRLIRVHDCLVSLNDLLSAIVGQPPQSAQAQPEASHPKPPQKAPQDADASNELDACVSLTPPEGQTEIAPPIATKPRKGLAAKAKNRDRSLLGANLDALTQVEVDELLKNLFK